MGRPLSEIDAEQVYKLARIGCTLEEIGDILGCSAATLSRRFANECQRARGDFKSSLRRAQYVRAVRDRSDSMLIHMGKQHLGQADKLESYGPARTVIVEFPKKDGHDSDSDGNDEDPGPAGPAGALPPE